ncbi:hypothetical protein BDV10DRAFT_188456 [Aspergillus recurvatus]
MVRQVCSMLSFQVYKYQAVTVARYFVNHNIKLLPTPAEQDQWEVKQLKYKGPTALFHEIKPDFQEYFDVWRGLAELGVAILQLKDKYWKSIKAAAVAKEKVQAKL